MKKIAGCILLLGTALAFQASREPDRRPVELRAPVQDKNFFLLSLLERNSEAHAAVRSEPAFARIAAAQRAALDRAVSCDLDLDCNAAAFVWSDAQIKEGSAALAALYKTSPALRAVTDDALRASGMYIRYHAMDGPGLLERAWTDCMNGINGAIGVYILGKPARYAAIDSIAYDAKTDAWRRIVHHLAMVLHDDRASFDLAFSTSLRFALEVCS